MIIDCIFMRTADSLKEICKHSVGYGLIIFAVGNYNRRFFDTIFAEVKKIEKDSKQFTVG